MIDSDSCTFSICSPIHGYLLRSIKGGVPGREENTNYGDVIISLVLNIYRPLWMIDLMSLYEGIGIIWVAKNIAE